ncbi:tRNA (adenosine(37)-N6)-threonylcarbamoyltransferase complex ATPase subunit type 1 TsaE [Leptolyngbya sp. 7M]|uniref:tRNA (adenosine(37)-N6)-threonylcarbamoyltransferase complex ATPase subunit type 1 TsaE n=1 Tax=Leptolyngbya sp. 7M TaxID=2812896 RepID=UPI001B8AB0A8|nr:tRNA (adenosine(37)-N6)-threonylcarbamoyltransferase complex ATPase subunit type 1 TsaE [Leptolyngbya sp. 7M]QYO63365.1 tRNA (adenosine(37)-N6)-threonylcarbamoyltransferase complex ATPase subunit type 1 TsaE [Leptolyngbya sp. 7M]
MAKKMICETPEKTYELGKCIGSGLRAGDAVLLSGELGAGKTLLTKGMLDALGFDVDEVTSPSFTLVNLYHAETYDVYHIDLWRIEDGGDAAFSIGLQEIVEQENVIVMIEWAERLGEFDFPGRVLKIVIEGEGEDPRKISIEEN